MSSAQRLLVWFEGSARRLPWRREPRDPYQVLVSELMLQQTQVDRVVPRFVRFIGRFPSLQALADACEDEVLEAWSGLGYYRRARSLHRLSRRVIEGGGSLPRTADELQRLPGVGPYTAAAVASLAFDQHVPVLDGNVNRVVSRVLALPVDPRSAEGLRALTRWLDGLMKGSSPRRINEALMELGATVCRPRAPACDACPLAVDCAARASGRAEAFPPPRKRRSSVDVRWVAACCGDSHGRWLVRRVEDGPILRGLWLPPLAELTDGGDAVDLARRLVDLPLTEQPVALNSVRHHITHRRIRVIPIRLMVSRDAVEAASGRWVDPRDPGLPTSSLLKKLFLVSNL